MKKKEVILNADQVQPHDTDTEQAVLATFMRYNEKYQEFADIVNDSYFYRDKEKAIYRCIAGVVASGGITDINSLNSYAQSHDVGFELNREYFVEILHYYNAQTVGQDVMRLKDLAMRRLCWQVLMRSAQDVLDVTQDVDKVMTEFQTKTRELQTGFVEESDLTFAKAIEKLNAVTKENSDGGRQSLVTGIRMFDRNNLLRKGTMTVIAAFTSVGKSALALNIAMNVAKSGAPVVYYSLEMGAEELVARGVSKAAGINSSVIQNAKLTEQQQNQLHGAFDKYRHLPLYFDDSCTSSFDRTIRSIRRVAKKNGIKLAIIDYLQIYAQVGDDQEESLAYMSRAAKNVATEMGISVIVLSQLNRSGLHPTIKMLRGSGQIEESADNIVLIDRPDAYPDNKVTKYDGEFKDVSVKGTAKLILAKGRGVGTGCDLMRFDAEHTCFCEIVEQQAEKVYEHDDVLPF